MAQTPNTISPVSAGLIIALISIVSPIIFMFHPLVEGLPPHFTFYSLIYTYDYLHGINSLQLTAIYSLLAFLLITAPRFIFSYQVNKFYSGVSSLRRTLYAGFFAEIITIAIGFAVDLSTLISVIFGGWMTSLIFPLPIPLVGFLILKKMRSPVETEVWTDETTDTAKDNDFLKDSA
ncbi:MAG: hypothetical protein ACFFF4_11960 [Candidatus Thorarchaeota archaeon]